MCTILCINASAGKKTQRASWTVARKTTRQIRDLGSPKDWIKIIKEEGEGDMQVPDEAGDRGQG